VQWYTQPCWQNRTVGEPDGVKRGELPWFSGPCGMALDMDCSAKSAENVNELFQEIASRLTSPTPGGVVGAGAGAGARAGD